MTHSRRRALQIAAGSAVALTAGAAAIGADRVFTLIEAHRKATDMHGAALREQDRLGGLGYDFATEACHADNDAWRELVNTAPQTLAGLKAWASYLDEVRKVESWMLEDEAQAIVTTLARALTQCA
jgi:hypothetical protein